jgi:hypothetical protein
MSNGNDLIRRGDAIAVIDDGGPVGVMRDAVIALPAAPMKVKEQTPAAKWLDRGDSDPHGDRYNCERAALTKGELTDDELANGIFMADRYSLDLIVWQTAAKDRIRWLSRALTAALTPQPAPTLGDALELPEVQALKIALEMCPPTASPTTPYQDRVEAIDTWWRIWARPALAALKGGVK